MSNPTWSSSTTSDTVAETLSDYIKSKTILITGISPDGLGLDFCRAISAHSPTLLILAARNASKIAASQQYLADFYPSLRTKALVVDLSSLASVRTAAAELIASVERIDVIVNNAAIHATALSRTPEGYESSFATNHLGHFLLTNLLLKEEFRRHSETTVAPGDPAVVSQVRVVNVTSNSFRQGGVLWDDVHFERTGFGEGWEAYSQSKTCNVLFSRGLARRFGGRGVFAYSLHPGLINTAMAKKMDMDDYAAKFNVKLNWKSFAQGTATHTVAAFDPAIEPQNGAFLTDCQVQEITGKEAEWATGEENVERLWKLSEELVGETFE